jgi:hypothetical protein
VAADAPRDSALVVLGLGVVAYVAATMLHEALGHGLVCLATGGRVTLLYPLGMRCSVVGPLMVAAGPATNLVAGALCWFVLAKTNAFGGNARYLLWLGMVFNLLVAAGYIAVGGLLNFGDWAYLIGGLQPPVAWRIATVVVAAALYYGSLRIIAAEYYRFTGPSGISPPRLYRLTLWPAAAAAVVSCAAAALSPTAKPIALELAVATTLVPGLSLLAVADLLVSMRRKPVPEQARVTWSIAWLAVALVVGVVFVAVVGPGIGSRG